MPDPLTGSAERLRAALARPGDSARVTLTLPRSVAEKVLALLDAERTTGAVVVPVKELFTTTQAATMLRMSRPTLMNLLESGEIDHVKVGTHHRVPAAALLQFQRAQRARRDKAAQALAEFSNEVGFTD